MPSVSRTQQLRERFEHFQRMDKEAWKEIINTGKLIAKWRRRNASGK